MPAKQAILNDIFISYCVEDKDLVEQIRKTLIGAKFTVWYDSTGIRKGEPLIKEIEEGLNTSRVMLLFLSPSALKSPWVEKEKAIRLQQSIEQPTVFKLIPILLPGVKDEERGTFIKSISYLDWRKKNLNSPIRFEKMINELVEKIRENLPTIENDTSGVPVVVYAMTEKEAKELKSKKCFKDTKNVPPIERDNFKNLSGILKLQGLDDIPIFYGHERDDWRPQLASLENPKERNTKSIKETLGDIFKQHQDHDVHFKFHSQAYFSDDDSEAQYEAWGELEEKGGILIVDAISLFHPQLRKKLSDSGIGTKEETSIIVLSPVGDDTLKLNAALEKVLLSAMRRAFGRFVKFDSNCKFGVDHITDLNSWLFSLLPKLKRPDVPRPSRKNIEAMNKKQRGAHPTRSLWTQPD